MTSNSHFERSLVKRLSLSPCPPLENTLGTLQHLGQPLRSLPYKDASNNWQLHYEPGVPTRLPSPALDAAIAVKRIPRPPNAWILYRSDKIAKMRASMPEGAPKPTQADLSKQFAAQWRDESEGVKSNYERLADLARGKHIAKYPDWKFSRKSPKVLTNAIRPSTSSTQAKSHKRARTLATVSNPSLLSEFALTSEYIDNIGTSIFSDATISQSYNNYKPSNTRMDPPLSQNEHEHEQAHQPYLFPSPVRLSTHTVLPNNRVMDAGLEETLARRNSSATEFFSLPFRSSPGSSRTTTQSSTRSEEHGSAAIYDRHVINRGYPTPYDTHHSNEEATQMAARQIFAFDRQAPALASMPFGLNPLNGRGLLHETRDIHNLADFQQANYHWVFPEQAQHQTRDSHTFSQPYENLNIPDWLRPFCHVRIRADDITGIPLGDFLTSFRNASEVPVLDAFVKDKADIRAVQDPSPATTTETTNSQQYFFP